MEPTEVERTNILVAEALEFHRQEMTALLSDWLSKLELSMTFPLPSGARSPRAPSRSRFAAKPLKSSNRVFGLDEETFSDPDTHSMQGSERKEANNNTEGGFKLTPGESLEDLDTPGLERLGSTLSYEEAKRTDVAISRAWLMGLGSGGLSPPQITLGWWNSFHDRVAKLMDSQWANAFWTIAILTNSVYLGFHLQWTSQNKGAVPHEAWDTVHLAYAILFTAEVVLRVIAVGFVTYLCGKDWKWSWLDLFVVVTSWAEITADRLAANGAEMRGTNTNLRIIRVLRLGRLVRVVRVVRVVRLFRALRTLVASLMGTLKSLFWSFLLLFLVIYIFGILFTDVAVEYAFEHNPPDDDVMQVYFGNLYLSMNTLFRAIANGISWSTAADSFRPAGFVWVQFFHAYVAFCLLALLNVMTGVFCNSAIKAAENDHDLAVQSLVQTRKEMQEQVANLFRTIDERGLGQVTISEFERNFDKDAVKAFFEVLKIGAVDAWTLFSSLDKDGDHTVSVDEFTERCLQLHGPASAADLFAMKQQTAKLSRQLRQIADLQGRHLQQVARLMSTVLVADGPDGNQPATAEQVTFKF